MTNGENLSFQLTIDDWLHYRWCRLVAGHAPWTLSPVTGYLFVFNLFACLSVGFQMFARANTKDAALSWVLPAALFYLARPLANFIPLWQAPTNCVNICYHWRAKRFNFLLSTGDDSPWSGAVGN